MTFKDQKVNREMEMDCHSEIGFEDRNLKRGKTENKIRIGEPADRYRQEFFT